MDIQQFTDGLGHLLNAALTALGIKKVVAAAGMIGGLVSLRFFEGLTGWNKVFVVASGAAMANYLTDPAIDYFTLAGKYEGGIGFALGLFGMSVSAAIFKVFREIDWAEIIKTRLGGRP